MTINSNFTVDGVALSGAMEVEYAASVALAVVDTTGAHTIAWSVVGSSSSGLTDPTITPAGSPPGATASFPQVADPGTGQGASFGIKCLITDSAGKTDATIAVIGTKNEAGIVPGYGGEETERDSTHGWLDLVNRAASDNISQALSVNTTNAGVTTVLSHALAANTMSSCGCRVVTVETNGANFWTFVREWTWAYERHDSKAAGAPTKVVADSDGGVPSWDEDGAWSAVVDVAANTMRIRVTNDAAQNCTSRVQLWVAEVAIA